MNVNYHSGVPLLNFEGFPGVPPLNFERGSHFYTLGGSQVELLKLEEEPGSQGPQVLGHGVLVSLLHHA